MVYADSESKPEKGVAEAERFINTEKVNVLTGCWNSAVSYPDVCSGRALRHSVHRSGVCLRQNHRTGFQECIQNCSQRQLVDA